MKFLFFKSQSKSNDEGSRWGALAYPNFRKFWLATVMRVFALQFRIIGLPWLVGVDLDKSPGWVGIVALCTALPTIILSLPAGSLADRFDNRKMILWSNTASGLLYLILTCLVVFNVVELWMVIVWALVSGTLAGFVSPAQQAILPQLIDMKAIASAVALNGLIWNVMRILGPAIAGVIIALIGVGPSFFVTTIGYAIASYLLITLHLESKEKIPGKTKGAMLEGVKYVFSHGIFISVIGLSFFTSVFGGSYQILLVYFAEDVLRVGAVGFGLLEAAAGIGAILGTIVSIKVGSGKYRGALISGGAAIFGLCIALFAASEYMPFSMATLFAGGFAAGIYLNLGMVALQTEVPDRLRGRVMGIWSITWFLTSVGGFFAGIVAELIGIQLTVAIGSLSVTLFAITVYLLSKELRLLKPLQISTDRNNVKS